MRTLETDRLIIRAFVLEDAETYSQVLDPAACASIDAPRASARAAVRRGPFVDIVRDLLR